MKILIHNLLIIGVLLGTSSCFDEYDGTIDVSQPWVYFESTNIRFDEDRTGSVTATVIFSGPTPTQDVSVPFIISSEDGLSEGVDYIISLSEVTIPAGQHRAVVNVLDGVVNNSSIDGDRSLTVTLQDAGQILGGFPGPARNNSSYTVTIAEDDFIVFGETSFEEVTSPPDDIFYTKSGTVEMNNNVGDPPVDFVAIGNELGFNTSSVEDDLVDAGGERLGVLSNAAISSSGDTEFQTEFQRGTQGYVSSDLDGRIEIVFDDIDIPDETSFLILELSFFANSATFETEDRMEVFYVVGGSKGDPLMSFFGDNDTTELIDVETGLSVEGSWITKIVEIPTSRIGDGNILITMRNGANSEMLLVDYVGLKGF